MAGFVLLVMAFALFPCKGEAAPWHSYKHASSMGEHHESAASPKGSGHECHESMPEKSCHDESSYESECLHCSSTFPALQENAGINIAFEALTYPHPADYEAPSCNGSLLATERPSGPLIPIHITNSVYLI